MIVYAVLVRFEVVILHALIILNIKQNFILFLIIPSKLYTEKPWSRNHYAETISIRRKHLR